MKLFLKDQIRKLRIWGIRKRMQSLPGADFSGRRVVIVAPHPDDEVIGCGGLIARLCAEGNPPHVVILSQGEASHRSCCDISAEKLAAARHALSIDAAGILGLPIHNLHCLDFPDGKIPHEDSEGRLAALLQKLSPEVVMVPHWGEGWPDHLNAAQMAKSAAPEGAEIYEYCVWFWYYMVLNPDWHSASKLQLSASEHTGKKAAVEAYLNSKAPCGSPWSGNLPNAFVKAAMHNTELYFQRR